MSVFDDYDNCQQPPLVIDELMRDIVDAKVRQIHGMIEKACEHVLAYGHGGVLVTTGPTRIRDEHGFFISATLVEVTDNLPFATITYVTTHEPIDVPVEG